MKNNNFYNKRALLKISWKDVKQFLKTWQQIYIFFTIRFLPNIVDLHDSKLV